MIEIAGRKIGPGQPCFVIAEAGVNHDGDLATALRLVDAAAAAGADAIKFQTFSADRTVTADAPKAAYQIGATDPGETQLEMLKRLELSDEDHRVLRAEALRHNLLFLSTPFEEQSADFLDSLGVPAFKLPSGELTNLPFLAHVARKGLPMIVSTGMATLEETRAAVRTIRRAGNHQFALLHCVSAYPAPAHDSNLRAIGTLERAFRCPVGFSDHTMGIEVSLAAVALGACIIEKHFTLDRKRPGPDHTASLEPNELGAMIRGIRTVQSALGHGRKEPAACEAEIAAVSRKNIVAARAITAGTRITRSLVVMKCAGTGLAPSSLPAVLGRTATRDIPKDTAITLEMLQ